MSRTKSFISSERRGTIFRMTNRWKNALENGELTDVAFSVGRDHGLVKLLRAHKLLLSLSSDVFHAMFNGNFTENQTKAIEIPDISPDAFSNLLDFLYTETMENLTPENVLQTLYAAEKYDLPWLADHCTQFVLEKLDWDNCLTLLDGALHLTPDCDVIVEECLRIVDWAGIGVLYGEHFSTIRRKTLETIVQRDSLDAEEHVIYLAVDMWASAACGRAGLSPSAANLRRVLGYALFQVRFPCMTDAQLAEGPVQSGLLGAEELRDIYLYKHLAKTDSTPTANQPILPFRTTPRRYVHHKIGCMRFDGAEKVFVRMANGYWCAGTVEGENYVYTDYTFCTEKGINLLQPLQAVRAKDILRYGLPIYARIDGVYVPATYGALRAGQHIVSCAGKEYRLDFLDLRITNTVVQECKAVKK
ncbi:BTB/POZ domain-containing protein 6-B-like [Paramacrobiotus metropolitanus]|uniref:BTB/POZ domain-containing protein 6-B-like n=1 Tax=Paramacrobiotus metropolitanus TaxID=2943436 RepID=UPI002445F11A|nr:BTB/POZ domain-containing protein 6-B-like [Paramacrobiotus metropolitanus]